MGNREMIFLIAKNFWFDTERKTHEKGGTGV